MTIRSFKNSLGFTLLELVVVMGILSVLLLVVLTAINPARQFAQANNTKRWSNINAILTAVNQYMIDNNGKLPTGVDTTIRTVSNNTSITTRADICSIIVPQYVAKLPVDPSISNDPVINCSDTYNTGYTIVQDASNNRITVSAPNAEGGEEISASR